MATNNKDIGKLLRKYGYGLPLTEDEVVAFENKYCKDYETPKEWSSIDDIINEGKIEKSKVVSLTDIRKNKSVSQLSMAAREGKEITDEIRKKMKEDKKNAKK